MSFKAVDDASIKMIELLNKTKIKPRQVSMYSLKNGKFEYCSICYGKCVFLKQL